MALYLEILSGPLEGKKFKATVGLRIGRREGEILLEDDSKVSGLHAQVEMDNKDRLVLLDQGSANAFVLNSRRVKKVALLPGVTFRVGETLMTVKETQEDLPEFRAPKPWQDVVESLLSVRTMESHPHHDAGKTFTPVLQLDFQQGVQADTLLTCAYGPRQAGVGHLDLELLDPDALDLSFELIPGPGVALFLDHSQGRITINEAPPESHQPLSEGDLIRLGGTVIRIRYL